MNRKSILSGLIALTLWLPAQAAKIEPLAEIQQLPEVDDEAALWESASKHEMRLRNNGTIFHDPHIESYLEDLTDRLLGDYLDHLGISIDFILVEEPTLSAWVYPYGTVALHTGLLVRMDNEAQLAAIVAHEISHFLQRHTYREVVGKKRNRALGKGLGFLATLAVARETGTIDTDIMDFTGELWTNLSTSGYSKGNEYEADEEGLLLMANAGLARDEAIPAFQALGENSVYGAADPRKMFSSHPRLEDRIRNLEKEIKREKRRKEYQEGSIPDPVVYYRGIAPALLINARLDMAEQHFDRARESLDRYLMVQPDDAEALFLLGETHRRENPSGPDFAAATAAYHSAIEKDSGYAAAYRELGMTHRINQENIAAKEAFEQYLAIAADAPDAGIVRGYLEGLK